MWERTHKTNHSQQHFKLIFKSVVDEVLTFITLQNTKKVWESVLVPLHLCIYLFSTKLQITKTLLKRWNSKAGGINYFASSV